MPQLMVVCFFSLLLASDACHLQKPIKSINMRTDMPRWGGLFWHQILMVSGGYHVRGLFTVNQSIYMNQYFRVNAFLLSNYNTHRKTTKWVSKVWQKLAKILGSFEFKNDFWLFPIYEWHKIGCWMCHTWNHK